MTCGSLMKVKSIAGCSLGAFCSTFELHLAIISLKKPILVFFLSGRLRQVLLYIVHVLKVIHQKTHTDLSGSSTLREQVEQF